MNSQVPIKISKRTRRLVFQALYQWQLNRQNTYDIERQFREENKNTTVDWDQFRVLLSGVVSMSDALDATLEPLLDRKISELDAVELSLLRLSNFELQEQLHIPLKVIINESIVLARTYGGQDSYKYINAILDKLCSKLSIRQAEKDRQHK